MPAVSDAANAVEDHDAVSAEEAVDAAAKNGANAEATCSSHSAWVAACVWTSTRALTR